MLFTDNIKTDVQAQQRVREWIAALRSGKYAQDQSWLRTLKGYCCLGVACDLFDNSMWVLTNDHYAYSVDDVNHVSHSTLLPSDIVKSLHLVDECGAFNDDVNGATLAGMNDEGKSFSEIADTIEKALNEMLGDEYSLDTDSELTH